MKTLLVFAIVAGWLYFDFQNARLFFDNFVALALLGMVLAVIGALDKWRAQKP